MLVVDDVASILKVITLNLKLNGYDVATAGTGIQAVDLIRERQPDLVILDLVLPDKTGYEVIKEIRSFSKLPILVITASPEKIKMALKLGADHGIPKPFDPEELITKIDSMLNISREAN